MTDALERQSVAKLSEECAAALQAQIRSLFDEVGELRRKLALQQRTIDGLVGEQEQHGRDLDELKDCRQLGKRGD